VGGYAGVRGLIGLTHVARLFYVGCFVGLWESAAQVGPAG
jgi:hypothetical protein